MRISLGTWCVSAFFLIGLLNFSYSCKPAGSDKKKSEKNSENEQTEEDCELGGGTWSNVDTCDCGMNRRWDNTYKRCTESSLNGSLSTEQQESNCTSSGGYWDGTSCDCNNRNTRSGYWWYEGKCEYSSTSSSSGDTQACSNEGGSWDSVNNRCNCTYDKIWHQNRCQLLSGMTSEQICTTDFNRGTWQGNDMCRCPDGNNWVNRKCNGMGASTTNTISQQQNACANIPGASWNYSSNTCNCPNPNTQRWDAFSMNCENYSGLNNQGVQQNAYYYCQQSQGQPGYNGQCVCNTPNIVQTVVGLNFQICIPSSYSAQQVCQTWQGQPSHTACTCQYGYQTYSLTPSNYQICLPMNNTQNQNVNPGSGGNVLDWLQMIFQ